MNNTYNHAQDMKDGIVREFRALPSEVQSWTPGEMRAPFEASTFAMTADLQELKMDAVSWLLGAALTCGMKNPETDLAVEVLDARKGYQEYEVYLKDFGLIGRLALTTPDPDIKFTGYGLNWSLSQAAAERIRATELTDKGKRYLAYVGTKTAARMLGLDVGDPFKDILAKSQAPANPFPPTGTGEVQ